MFHNQLASDPKEIEEGCNTYFSGVGVKFNVFTMEELKFTNIITDLWKWGERGY